MKLAFHGATSIKADLVTDVKASASAGFKALEVWAAKVDDYLQNHSLAQLRALFVDNQVEPVSINSIEFIGFRGDEYPQIRDRCRELCSIAEGIGCPTLVVVPSPTPRAEAEKVLDLFFPWEEVVDEYVKILRDMSDIAQPYGVRLAFEFLGFAWSSVRTPRGACEIVQKTDRTNVGMNFDACHFYGGGGQITEIDTLDPTKIYTFHLNDMEDVPKEAITDSKRLLPGLGVIPLDDICAHLKGIGYDGPCAIELFRAEYWAWDPYELAVKAREAALEVLSPHFEVEQNE
jgi:2-keto-myo-inositol isomerase